MGEWSRQGWANDVLKRAAQRITGAKPTQRAGALDEAATMVAPYVAAGDISYARALDRLMNAAVLQKMSRTDASQAIRLALRDADPGEATYPEGVDEDAPDSTAWVKPRAPDGDPYLLKPFGTPGWLISRPEGGYRWTDPNLVRGELKELWPDISIGEEDDKGKWRPYHLEELKRRYGFIVDRLHYTWVDRGRAFEVDDRGVSHLHLQCGDRPRIEPRFHEDVDEWLRVLGGDKYEQLLNWVAALPQLDQVVAALYLHGPPGIGKGLFAHICAQMYGAAPAPYKKVVLERFNALLLETPVVLLDESIPRTKDGSSLFRAFIGVFELAVEQKNKPVCMVELAPRTIIAANHGGALNLADELLDGWSERAIGQRVLMVNIPVSAEGWFDSRGGRDYVDGWVKDEAGRPGRACKHFRWIAENHEITPGKRWLVEGESSEWMRMAAQRDGLTNEILTAIGMALTDTSHHIPEPQNPAWVASEGEELGVFVCAKPLSEFWKRLTGRTRSPSYTALGRELKKITGARAKNRRHPSGTRKKSYRVDPKDVLAAALNDGVVDVEFLETLLGVDAEAFASTP